MRKLTSAQLFKRILMLQILFYQEQGKNMKTYIRVVTMQSVFYHSFPVKFEFKSGGLKYEYSKAISENGAEPIIMRPGKSPFDESFVTFSQGIEETNNIDFNVLRQIIKNRTKQ